MTATQYALLTSIIGQCNSDELGTAARRRGLAKRISQALNIWDDITLSFLQDMRGLDLSTPEDREIFLQFAHVGLV